MMEYAAVELSTRSPSMPSHPALMQLDLRACHHPAPMNRTWVVRCTPARRRSSRVSESHLKQKYLKKNNKKI